MSKLKGLQLTLALIKPNSSCVPHSLSWVEDKLLRQNFLILKREEMYWSSQKAEKFYEQHKGKFFYQRLVAFMSSGPLVALVLAKNNAVDEWRNIIGPTKAYESRFTNPQCFRGEFGFSDTRNAAHGSDSDDSARSEIKFCFPEFDFDHWRSQEEEEVRENLKYDKLKKVHMAEDAEENEDLSSLQEEESDDSEDDDSMWDVDYELLRPYIAKVLNAATSTDDRPLVLVSCAADSDLAPSIAAEFRGCDVHCLSTTLPSLRTQLTSSDSALCTYVSCDRNAPLPYPSGSATLLIDEADWDPTVDRLIKSQSEARFLLKHGGSYLNVTESADAEALREGFQKCREFFDISVEPLDDTDDCSESKSDSDSLDNSEDDYESTYLVKLTKKR